MLEKIRSRFSSKEVIYDSNRMKIVRDSGEYVFNPTRNDDHSKLLVGTSEYNLEAEELNFSTEFINQSNAAFMRGNEPEVILGENVSENSLNVFLSTEQLHNLESISMNRGENILSDTTEFSYQVFDLDEFWCISVSGLKDNMPYKFTVCFNSLFPDFTDSMNASEEYSVDLSTMERRYITISAPSYMNGDFLVGGKSFSFDELNGETISLNTLRSASIYARSYDSIEDAITKWNECKLDIVARPNLYSNVRKSVELSECNTTISFSEPSFDELATLQIKYPDNLDVSPWISMSGDSYNWEYNPEHIKRYEYKEGVYEFTVYPADIRVFHGDMLWFEDNTTKLSMDSGEVQVIQPDLKQKRVELSLTNSLDVSAIVELNGNTEHIKPDATTSIESEIGEENNIHISDTNGEKIVSKTVDRTYILEHSDSLVSEI